MGYYGIWWKCNGDMRYDRMNDFSNQLRVIFGHV